MGSTLQNDSVHTSYIPYASGGNINNGGMNTNTTACLNEKLQTEHIDVSDDDTSTLATITRTISRFVGHVFTPRQVLGLLRVLKAITLSFLVLTILSDCMYIIFVELLANEKIQLLAGGHRDTIIRIYGLVLACVGLAIELDYSKVVRKFSALKGFIPRSLIYFFIMQITGSHPIMIKYKQNKNHAAANYEIYDDDLFDLQDIQIPSSAIGFQRVTAFVLGFCAIGYFICGLLCFDRFTARAFLSSKDPRITTALPVSATPPRASTKNVTLSTPTSSNTAAIATTAVI